ncbi:hypothetical protein AEYBE204_01605 [Asticcacaulis sp. YBE204]|nr:hypothetical protein AEYBE204_01605 [Asticcacaulis sp. YBE204]
MRYQFSTILQLHNAIADLINPARKQDGQRCSASQTLNMSPGRFVIAQICH